MVARVSLDYANKIDFKLFGHIEHPKQTSLAIKPSIYYIIKTQDNQRWRFNSIISSNLNGGDSIN